MALLKEKRTRNQHETQYTEHLQNQRFQQQSICQVASSHPLVSTIGQSQSCNVWSPKQLGQEPPPSCTISGQDQVEKFVQQHYQCASQLPSQMDFESDISYYDMESLSETYHQNVKPDFIQENPVISSKDASEHVSWNLPSGNSPKSTMHVDQTYGLGYGLRKSKECSFTTNKRPAGKAFRNALTVSKKQVTFDLSHEV